MVQKHLHPPADELEYLYNELDNTVKQIADIYEIPQYTVSYLLTKNNIRKDPEIWRSRKRKRILERISEMGFTKEKLKVLYIDKEMSIMEIADLYNVSHVWMSEMLGVAEIEKRTHSEVMKITGRKIIKKNKEAKQTEFNKKLEKIRAGLDSNPLNHLKALKLVSCDLGIERLKKLCDLYGYNFEILSNTYRKLERVWFKLNLYPKIMIKIAIVLYIRYEIHQNTVSQICKITDSGLRANFLKIKKHIKLTKERRIDPLPLINIAWLFETPRVPQNRLNRLMTPRNIKLENYLKSIRK